LNPYFALTCNLDKIFFALTLKIVLQHYRHEAGVGASRPAHPELGWLRTRRSHGRHRRL